METPLDPRKYGLDVFSFKVTLSPDGDGGIQIATFPFQINAVSDELMEIFPAATESDSSEVSGAMGRCGSVKIIGIKSEHRPRVINILRRERDTLARQFDLLVSSGEMVRLSAESIIQNSIVTGNMPSSPNDLEVTCGTCVVHKLEELAYKGAMIVSGAPCSYPSDFQADFNTLQAQRVFDAIVERARDMPNEYDVMIEKMRAEQDMFRTFLEQHPE